MQSAVDRILCSVLNNEPALWSSELQLVLVFQQANVHGIVALLHAAAEKGDFYASWPPAFKDRILNFSRHAAANEILLQEELQRCLSALHSAGVNTLLTKGALVAHTLYDTTWHRPRCDSDLFIPETDKEKIIEVLRDIGYSRYNSIPGFLINRQSIFTRDIGHGLTHSLDIHWHLFNRIVLDHLLPFELCWDQRVPVASLGNHACGLRPAHALLHACLHRLAHHGDEDRLIWLYDILLLCRSLDVMERERFSELCRTTGTSGVCSVSLSACQRSFSAPEVAATLDPLVSNPGPNDLPIEKIISGDPRQNLANDLGALRSWRKKTHLLWQHAFPSTRYMRKRYNVDSIAILPWYYLRRLVRGSIKLIRTPSPSR